MMSPSCSATSVPLPSCRSFQLMRTTSESSAPRFGCATVSSLLAEDVAEPAAASASSSVIEPVIVIFPGCAHFAAHEHALALELADLDAHLRIPDESGRQQRADAVLQFSELEPAGGDAADVRERDEAVAVHPVAVGQIGLVEDRDLQQVLRPNRVLGRSGHRRRLGPLRRGRRRSRGRLLRQQAGKQKRNEKVHTAVPFITC